MLEILLATVGVMFTPVLTKYVSPPGDFLVSMVLGYLLNLTVIIVITVASNIIRALRYCRDENGAINSFGLIYGIKKGLLCGCIAMGASFVIGFIPILRMPFTLISVIPGFSTMIDGFILAVFYLLSYSILAYRVC